MACVEADSSRPSGVTPSPSVKNGGVFLVAQMGAVVPRPLHRVRELVPIVHDERPAFGPGQFDKVTEAIGKRVGIGVIRRLLAAAIEQVPEQLDADCGGPPEKRHGESPRERKRRGSELPRLAASAK
jgi:hypothetical protein